MQHARNKKRFYWVCVPSTNMEEASRCQRGTGQNLWKIVLQQHLNENLRTLERQDRLQYFKWQLEDSF